MWLTIIDSSEAGCALARFRALETAGVGIRERHQKCGWQCASGFRHHSGQDGEHRPWNSFELGTCSFEQCELRAADRVSNPVRLAAFSKESPTRAAACR